jgi:hypothetical protein
MKRAWFSDKNGDHRVFWHWQALKGRGIRSGRAWLHTPAGVFRAEWHVGLHGPGFRIGVDDDGPEVSASIFFGLASLYTGFESRWLYKVLGTDKPYRYIDKSGTYRTVEPRELSITTFGGALWWHLWMNPMESSSRDPKWRRGAWHPMDTFFGRQRFSREVLAEEGVVIPLPEYAYRGTVRLEWLTWKRPRWPWAKSRLSANVEVESGLPIPGKGENAWDCDDDAIYSISFAARTVPEAIGHVVQAVLEDRWRYGGSNWSPEVPADAL